MNQLKIDSIGEVLLNTAIGYLVSVIMWSFLSTALGLATSTATNFLIVSVFTVTSIIRQYVLRRLFNRGSPYVTLKRFFTARKIENCWPS